MHLSPCKLEVKLIIWDEIATEVAGMQGMQD